MEPDREFSWTELILPVVSGGIGAALTGGNVIGAFVGAGTGAVLTGIFHVIYRRPLVEERKAKKDLLREFKRQHAVVSLNLCRS